MSYHKTHPALWNGSKNYSFAERELIRKTYQKNIYNASGWLVALAKELNRPKQNISRFARQNGWSNIKRGTKNIEAKCAECGITFYKKPYDSNHTCSKKCGDILGAKIRTGGHLWKDKEHPRGMLGKKQPKEMCENQSKRMIESWKNPKSPFNSDLNKKRTSDRMSQVMIDRLKNNPENVYSRTIKGWREIGGQRHFFRSKWEMNIAYYLEWLKLQHQIKSWDYEAETFWFENIRRGVRSYTPDFKITENNDITYFIEVKGWMDSKSKTKLSRMKKYYPKIRIDLYDESMYKTLKRQIGKICNWE